MNFLFDNQLLMQSLLEITVLNVHQLHSADGLGT